jgi:GDPmannose 4,6-dehydratase
MKERPPVAGRSSAPVPAAPAMAPAGRRALLTGLTGQDGSYLAELLLEKGYAVSAVVRGPAQRDLGCSEHLRGGLTLIAGDLLDPASLRAAVERAAPQEIYHLAAPSFVPDSWRQPEQTMRAIVGATAALLETVRDLDRSVRVYVAASGAMYGDAGAWPQREDTPCRPDTPYAVAKLAAHQLVGAMRAHDYLWACSGIVFNHESERRPEQFVTRRITRGVAEIALGMRAELTVGDLQAVRDWSFAGDVVRGAWLMLQQEQPEDCILASGVARTVKEFADAAFACVDLRAEPYLRVDTALLRAPERTPSVGDPGKAQARLGWRPRVSFEELVQRMVRADLARLGEELPGYTAPRET